MPTALFRAFADLFAPSLRGIVALSVALAAASFLVLWVVVAVGLGHLPTLGWRAVNWFIDLLGTVGVLLLSWLLFPAIVTLIMGFFLERVAAAVEAAHYPGRNPPRDQSIREIAATAIRLALASLALNLLALPIYFLLPVLNIAVYLVLNGYLLGRSYFETVALRRLDVGAVREARRHHAGRVFIGGVTLAAIFAVPFVNLVAPVIATAFMIHIFEEMRQRAG
jgi:CysZ protein